MLNSLFRDTASFLHDESAQDLVEYALIACVIGLGAVASMKGLANSLKTVFTSVGTTITGSV